MFYHFNTFTLSTSASTGACHLLVELKKERLVQLSELDGLEEENWRQGDQ